MLGVLGEAEDDLAGEGVFLAGLVDFDLCLEDFLGEALGGEGEPNLCKEHPCDDA